MEGCDAALITHLDAFDGAIGGLAELPCDGLDERLDSEATAAAHAFEGSILLDDRRVARCLGEVEPGREPDDFLGAGGPAKAALYAGILDEAQAQRILAALESSGRTDADAREAHRTTRSIDIEGSEWCTFTEEQTIDRAGRTLVQTVKR